MNNLSNFYSSFDSSDYSQSSSNIRFKNIFEGIKIDEKSILDYGCGPGNLVSWFLAQSLFPKCYFGYDIRRETIEYASRKFESCQNLEFSDTLPKIKFDLIVLCGTISYAFDNVSNCKFYYRNEIKNAINYLLKPDGMLLATARKKGWEFSKLGHKMITYTDIELKEIGASKLIDLFDHEFIFEIKKEGFNNDNS